MGRKNREDKLAPLEEGLLVAFRALDNQISRDMQRTPAEEEALGVLKWEPYLRRIERVSSFLIDKFGENEIDLDSLLVVAQATAKTLKILTEELGEEGLGKIRSRYSLEAFHNIQRDTAAGIAILAGNEPN